MSGHELVAFLQAQFDEDEAEISKHPDDEYCEPQGYLADIEQNYPCSPYLRIGKTRALAEVAVKRRIIDRHQPRLVESRDGDGIERESYHLQAIADRTRLDFLAAHPGCDLVVGQYSYPLVKVACPAMAVKQTINGHSSWHTTTRWYEADWLRLLHAAYQQPNMQGWAEAAGRMCWPADRLNRLRYAIRAVPGEEAVRPPSCCAACDALFPPSQLPPSRLGIPGGEDRP
jgi:hypothetical protein